MAGEGLSYPAIGRISAATRKPSSAPLRAAAVMQFPRKRRGVSC